MSHSFHAGIAVLDDRMLKALAHPLRTQIALIFGEGDASPKEIAQRLRAPLPKVSYHVGVLRDLGFIRLCRMTPRRGAVEHHYSAVVRVRGVALDAEGKGELIAAFARLLDAAPSGAQGLVLDLAHGVVPEDLADAA